YPKYSGNTQGYLIEYFKNITQEIYEGLKTAFEQKGYKVFDLKQLSRSWEKPFHEMTIEKIVTALSGKADYLFVFHYMDIGNSSIDSKTYRVKASNSGFTSMVFSYTLFDIAEQEDVFSYSPMIGFAVMPSIIYNPEIMENPELRKRIIINCNNENKDESYKFSHDFTDSELIKLLLNNILNGFSCPDKKYIDCYDKCRFYEIKGLIPQIP
ncbi:MAG: hypothetical protein JXA06_06265, partial [Bacteroidetes bacterium]|nr:hypothetical protein [Bacteroidota bacterium]